MHTIPICCEIKKYRLKNRFEMTKKISSRNQSEIIQFIRRVQLFRLIQIQLEILKYRKFIFYIII